MRYFFDTEGGAVNFRDEVGVELASLAEAQATAGAALIELARDEAAKGTVRELRMLVRNAQGLVLKATLQLKIEEMSAGG